MFQEIAKRAHFFVKGNVDVAAPLIHMIEQAGSQRHLCLTPAYRQSPEAWH